MENSLRPVILFFHGGGCQGDNSEFPNMMQTTQFFGSRGWVVFVVNYRLVQDFGNGSMQMRLNTRCQQSISQLLGDRQAGCYL
jgi:acetyl esterase/lipase